MIIYSVARSPELRFHSPHMSRRSTQAFSLLEALAMIVTLFVFGWLCVGVIRYDMKHHEVDPHDNVKFTTKDAANDTSKDAKPSATEPVKADDKAKAESAPANGSQPAGSPAPAKP